MTPPFAVRGCYVLLVPQNTNFAVVRLTRQDTASGMRIAMAVQELFWARFSRLYSLSHSAKKVKKKLYLIAPKFRREPFLPKLEREVGRKTRIFVDVFVNNL